MTAVGDARKRSQAAQEAAGATNRADGGSGAGGTENGAERRLRDLVSRLGFGDNITEPMASNDTIVDWYDEQASEAAEWRESQRWRDDCYAAGHPDDEDCREHDPTLRLAAAEAALARVRALAAAWTHEADQGAESAGHPLLVQAYRGHAEQITTAIEGTDR